MTIHRRKIPLKLLTVDGDGNCHIDRSVVMTKREETYPVDTSRPFKLNAGTSGVCT
jgi:aminopeptidase 2